MGTQRDSEVAVDMDDSAILDAVGGAPPGAQDTGVDDHEHYVDDEGSTDPLPDEETGTEQAASDDDYTPPTREEWEAMKQQNELLSGLTNEQIDAMLGQQQEDATEAPPTPVSQEDIAAMLTPKSFAPPPELLDKVLVDGDAGALTQIFSEFADVLNHNNRIEMNKAILNGLDYAMPVHRAVDSFFQRYPEMLGARETVNKHIWNIRNQNPQANELQIVRAVELRLAPVIRRAKQIAAQKGANPTKANLAPAPAGGGQQTVPRARANGAPPQPETAADRLKELSAFSRARNY